MLEEGDLLGNFLLGFGPSTSPKFMVFSPSIQAFRMTRNSHISASLAPGKCHKLSSLPFPLAELSLTSTSRYGEVKEIRACQEDGKWVLINTPQAQPVSGCLAQALLLHSMLWNLTTRIPMWNLLLEVTWCWALCYIWVFLFCIIRIWKGTSHSTDTKSINACSAVRICWKIGDFFISVQIRLVYCLVTKGQLQSDSGGLKKQT